MSKDKQIPKRQPKQLEDHRATLETLATTKQCLSSLITTATGALCTRKFMAIMIFITIPHVSYVIIFQTWRGIREFANLTSKSTKTPII